MINYGVIISIKSIIVLFKEAMCIYIKDVYSYLVSLGVLISMLIPIFNIMQKELRLKLAQKIIHDVFCTVCTIKSYLRSDDVS